MEQPARRRSDRGCERDVRPPGRIGAEGGRAVAGERRQAGGEAAVDLRAASSRVGVGAAAPGLDPADAREDVEAGAERVAAAAHRADPTVAHATETARLLLGVIRAQWPQPTGAMGRKLVF